MTRCGYCERILWPWQAVIRWGDRREPLHRRCWEAYWDYLLSPPGAVEALAARGGVQFWKTVLDCPDRWQRRLMEAARGEVSNRLLDRFLKPRVSDEVAAAVVRAQERADRTGIVQIVDLPVEDGYATTPDGRMIACRGKVLRYPIAPSLSAVSAG